MASKRTGSDSLFVMWDVTFPENDKVLEIGILAEATYFRAVLLCKRNSSDGVFTRAQIRRDVMDRMSSDQVDGALLELCDAGMLEQRSEREFFAPGFLERNHSAAEIDAEIDRRRSDGKWGNHVKHHINNESPKPSCEYCYPPGCDDDHDPLESPVVRPDSSGGRSGGDRGGDRGRPPRGSGAVGGAIGGGPVGDRGLSQEKEPEQEQNPEPNPDVDPNTPPPKFSVTQEASQEETDRVGETNHAEQVARQILTGMGSLPPDHPMPRALPGYIQTCIDVGWSVHEIEDACAKLDGADDPSKLITFRVGALARKTPGASDLPPLRVVS